jgi:hypothetical protein
VSLVGDIPAGDGKIVHLFLQCRGVRRISPPFCIAAADEEGRTDKKENHIFLIYKEIQNGAVAKSYMTNGLLIEGEIITHFLIY